MSEASWVAIRSNSAAGEITEVFLDPLRGGSVAGYRSRSPNHAMDWLVPACAAHPACFAMVPFCSRIEHGRFSFAGRTVQLPANNPPEPHAIHGHGFQQNWAVIEHGETSAVLHYTHPAGAWPWTYSAQQSFELCGRSLAVTLSVHNAGTSAMPLGMGLHPYFPKNQNTRLTAQVTRLCKLDGDLMPAGYSPVPAELAMAQGLMLDDLVLDHVFTGWQGEACIEWLQAKTSLVVRADANNLVVWSPPGAEFVCVEPVSNLPNAFNEASSPGQAFSVLEAGETASQQWSFVPQV